jgi:hypothetical protein
MKNNDTFNISIIYKLYVKDENNVIVYTVSSSIYNIIHEKYTNEKTYPIKEVWRIDRYINKENPKEVHERKERLINSVKQKQDEQI